VLDITESDDGVSGFKGEEYGKPIKPLAREASFDRVDTEVRKLLESLRDTACAVSRVVRGLRGFLD
jgi:hypothetical protein